MQKFKNVHQACIIFYVKYALSDWNFVNQTQKKFQALVVFLIELYILVQQNFKFLGLETSFGLVGFSSRVLDPQSISTINGMLCWGKFNGNFSVKIPFTSSTFIYFDESFINLWYLHTTNSCE